MLGVVLLIAGALARRALGIATDTMAADDEDRPGSQSIVRRSSPRSFDQMLSHGESNVFRDSLIELDELRHQRGRHKRTSWHSRAAASRSAVLAQDSDYIGIDGASRSAASPLLLDNTTDSMGALGPGDSAPQSLLEGSKYAVLKGFDDEDCTNAIGEFEFISKANFYATDNCFSVRKNGNAYGKTSWYCDDEGGLVIHLYKAEGDGTSSCSGDSKRQLTLEAFKINKFKDGKCVAALNLATKRIQYVSLHNRRDIAWPYCARGFTGYLALTCFILFSSFLVVASFFWYRSRKAKSNAAAQQGSPALLDTAAKPEMEEAQGNA